MVVREIEYQGFVFRSKIEAQWAFFMTQLDIPWFYEPDTVALTTAAGKTVHYLPDFFLPDQDAFLEVKLEPKPKLEECWKCYKLAVELEQDVLLVYEPIGKIDYNAYRYKAGTGEVECLYKLTTCPFCNEFAFTHRGRCGEMKCKCSDKCAELSNDRATVIKAAIDKTRKERFGS